MGCIKQETERKRETSSVVAKLQAVGVGSRGWASTELIRDAGMNCELCSLFSKAQLASATLKTFIPCLWESGGRTLHSQLHSAHADFN